MRRVLLSHVDSAVGRRLVKILYHDPDVALVLGVGTGPRPSFLDAYRDKCFYERLDLARARHLASFLGSQRFERARIDSVIHLPFAGDFRRERIPGNVPSLVSETRRLVEACRDRSARDESRIERFVYLSSGFVYRPEPGNANLMSEDGLLSFDADGQPEVRGWIDADLICQGELLNPHLKMTILRAATIVTDAGELLNSPPLAGGAVPLGFDPLLAVVSIRDVARALALALHTDRPGIYNVAGREVFPVSELGAASRRAGWVPGVRSTLALLDHALRRKRSSDYRRYGLVLDTTRAHEVLGFEPQYRLELRGAGRDRRIDAVRV